MRTCEEVLELLSAALDGELTAQEQAELNAHLAQCPSCSALSAQLTGLHRAMGELEDVPAPVGFADRVMAQVSAEGGSAQMGKVIPFPTQKRKRTPWKGWAAAAAVVAVVALGAVTLAGQFPLGQSGSTSSADARTGDTLAQADDLDGGASRTETTEDATGTTEDAIAVESEADSGALPADAAVESDAQEAADDLSAATNAAGSQAVRGVLTLSTDLLPKGIAQYPSDTDAAGNTVYTVPADDLMEYLAQLQAENAQGFTYASADADAAFGQIVVENSR
jgi:negative regulator of sigma E activity